MENIIMTASTKFYGLILGALLIGLTEVTTVLAEESDGRAPEATTAEASGSFRDIPYLENAFIDVSPANRNDGILVGELGVNDGSKDMLVKLAQEIAGDDHDNYDSLLISHKGKLIFESYYRRGRANLPHFQASATKTYTSMALGRAIQLGYLSMADLDKPVVSFLTELDPSRFVAGAELITLHNALTMTTGIQIADEQWAEFRSNPDQIQGQKQVQAILEHSEPITKETQTFLYGSGPGLIMQVIEAVVPGPAEDFIKSSELQIIIGKPHLLVCPKQVGARP